MKKSDKLNISFQIKSNLASYKEIDENSRTIKAVVNTYNFFDSDYDVLRLGCAKRSIDNRGAGSNANDKILHAFNHNLSELPGKSILEDEIIIDKVPVLYVESKLSESTDGENLLIKYKEGIYNQHSIGFQYKQIEYIERETAEWEEYLKDLINPEEAEKIGFGWDVKEINWFEWSTVAFGANKLTPYLGTKSENKIIQLNNLYAKLDGLIKASKKGIKNKSVFEMQYFQLKQMIKETMFLEQTKKPTREKDSGDNVTQKNRRLLLTKI